jgi:hypothetical protein
VHALFTVNFKSIFMQSLASTLEEILPLIEHCKAGRLKEVQEWIAQGKPLDLPPSEGL